MSSLLTHVEWILNNHGDQLKKALTDQGIGLSAEQALETMQAADPSERKLAVQWIFNSFLAKGYLWEDIACGEGSKVYNTLELFARNRMRLENESRNLSNYKRLAQLYTVVQAFDVPDKEHEGSNKSLKKQEKQEVLDESLIVYRSDTLIVSVPQTERAAKWWGKGTQWCTAADKNNYFDHYNDEAPLIVITFPQGLKIPRDKYDEYPNGTYRKRRVIQNPKGATRLQLWVNSSGGDIQFMNEQDDQLNESFIEENWQELSPFLIWILCNGASFNSLVYSFDGMGEEKLVSMFNEDQQLNIARKNPEILAHIKESPATREIFDLHIKNLTVDGNQIPQDVWTPDIAKAYILKNPTNISWIPKKIITFEFCSELLKQAPEQLQERILINILNYKNNTKKLWDKLCTDFKIANLVYTRNLREERRESNTKVETVFKGKSGVLKDNKWFKKITQENLSFKWVPYEYRTKELCEYCIKNGVAELDQVPEPLKTKELCMLAIEAGQGKIWDVPVELRDIDIYIMFFNKLDNALYIMPPDEISEDAFKAIIDDRIKRYTDMNQFLKDNFSDKVHYDYYQSILSGTGEGLLNRFDLGVLTLEKIVEINSISISSIPKTQQTKKMIVQALIQNDFVSSSINLDLLDEKDIVEICKANRKNIECFKELTPEIMENITLGFAWEEKRFSELKTTLELAFNPDQTLVLNLPLHQAKV